MTAEDYLRRVEWALRDLPWGARRRLLSEIGEHLAELPDGTALDERLGPPERYVADLRAAAELGRRRGPVAFIRARRPRNVILALIALIVIGLGIGFVAWVQSYQPIAFAGGTAWPPRAKGDLASGDAYVVFHKGRPFQYGVSILNSGRFTVRVVGVPHGSPLLFSARLLTTRPSKRFDMTGPYLPFHPFDLHPHEFVALLLRGVYACHTGMAAGGGMTLTGLPVRFSFLWKATTVEVSSGSQLTILTPKGCTQRQPDAATP